MQTPEEVVELTASYVRICGGGIFFIVAYNLLSAIFRGLGDSRSPLLFVLVLLKGDTLATIFSTDAEVVQKGFEYLKGFAPGRSSRRCCSVWSGISTATTRRFGS